MPAMSGSDQLKTTAKSAMASSIRAGTSFIPKKKR
jgi:hypothetical protein